MASRTVRVAGQAIAVEVREGADPPVVFVSGIGEPGTYWTPVIDRLTTGSWLLTYDRPGIGASPPRPEGTRPWPYRLFADELAGLLHRADVTAPVVLVGHSFGSLVVRAFAGRYPTEVAGVVHVDGTVPGWDRLWPEAGFNADGDGPLATRVDQDSWWRDSPRFALPDVPAVVLARTPGRWFKPPPSPEVDRFWQDGQRELAVQLGARLVVAEDSGHYLVTEAPALVADAVDEVVQAARGVTAGA